MVVITIDPSTLTLLIAIIGCIIAVLSFFRSGSNSSAIEAREMGRIEQKIDGLISDVREIKEQNFETAKMESQTKERLDTLFKWKDNTEKRLTALERK